MKKRLLSLAAVAAIAPAFLAFAEGETPTLTEIWKYQGVELNDGWDGTAPAWSSEDAIKSKPCARFATGKDGHIYTINMMTMSIAEITKDGMKDLYKLPSLEGRSFKDLDGNMVDDYYGTAISMDDAGNFLIGHYFVKPELSSRIWSVYNPTTGEIKHIDLGYPNGMSREEYIDDLNTGACGLGRIDCVGRVAGDFSQEAVFFIATPGYSKGGANNIRMVYSTGAYDGTLSGTEFFADEYISTYLVGSTCNIIQPTITDMSLIGDTMQEHFDWYIFNSTEGGMWDVIGYQGGALHAADCANFSAAWKADPRAHNNGFDSFVLDGKRYFVHGYSDNLEGNPMCMDIAVFDNNGEVVAKWSNPEYMSSAGYNSIVAQPQEDGTALIHVYVSTGSTNIHGIKDGPGCGAAAVVKFDPTGSAGIADIEIDSANAPAVYYNLQGVKVANPENGIYVVNRGGKVTKEIIK